MNFSVRLLAVTVVTALAACGTAAAAAHAAEPGPYVALGDSYTAAPLVPFTYGTPIGCARSDHNYPSVVRAALGASVFRDVSCSSATTDDMTAPQSVTGGSNPPQFDALSADTNLVTVGIGGNDVGLVGAAVDCVQLGLLAPVTGTACRSNFAKPGGGDRLVDQIAASAPKIAATLQGIHARSPQARVLIVGYPAVAPTDGRSCYPLVPLSADDLAYFDELLRATNTMLAAQAAANGAEFVDTYTESIGHDVCKLPPTRWFEGLVPTMPAYPIHPNVLGEASMARSVLRVLGQPRSTAAPALTALERTARSVRVGRAARFTYTLSRAARVTFSLRRSLGAGRYSKARRVVAVDGAAGANALTLTAKQLGRRAGLYRVTATPAESVAQTVQLRLKRR
jgi:lysophospholipase L1-like esterase